MYLRLVTVQPDHQEFNLRGPAGIIKGEPVKCFNVGYHHVAMGDGSSGVYRVHASQVVELSDVVDTVAIDIRRVGDAVLLHPVTVHWQRPYVLRELRRALFPPT